MGGKQSIAEARDAQIGLNVRLRCSDGQLHTIRANPFSTLPEFKAAIGQKTGIRPASQRLTLAGRCVSSALSQRTLGQIPDLQNGAIVFVTIVRDQFPEKLGPFATAVVPLNGTDFLFPDPGSLTSRQGTMWTLSNETAFSQVSPARTVTLTIEEKREANIPRDSQLFSWSYPVPVLEAIQPFLPGLEQ